MAKKSAKQKGYRKTEKKKPFLTKKEIIELVVIVAVIVIGIVLFNLFYDDGYLRTSDAQPGDVTSYVSEDVRNRYVKIAEVNDLPGFTRNDPDMSENARVIYTYTPDEETDSIGYISVSGSFIPADKIINTSRNQMESLGSDTLVFTEQQETTVQGHDAYIYSYTQDYYSAEEAGETEESAEEESADGEEEHESNVYNQAISCYVGVGDYTVCLYIYRTGEDDSFYLPEDQIVDYALKYTDAFTVYEKADK